jgi:hypothetical protein
VGYKLNRFPQLLFLSNFTRESHAVTLWDTLFLLNVICNKFNYQLLCQIKL